MGYTNMAPTKGTTVEDPTQEKWEGRWEQLKGRARQLWGDLTDDDLEVVEGNYEELIGRIKERTGQSREEIRSQLAKEG